MDLPQADEANHQLANQHATSIMECHANCVRDGRPDVHIWVLDPRDRRGKALALELRLEAADGGLPVVGLDAWLSTKYLRSLELQSPQGDQVVNLHATQNRIVVAIMANGIVSVGYIDIHDGDHGDVKMTGN